ncbi:MAG TPA: transglycosylase SLT domain-containing protein [Chitinispirillaceae bacterium]|nr:transglycosylase SLT domain-containing protein [Chitinispirillaceae bacterium]
MSAITEKSHRLRIGILLYGNKIWLSELLSYLIAAIVLGVLLAMGIMVLRNELTQTILARSIHSLQAEIVQTDNTLTILQEKVRIHTVISTFAKKRVSDSTILALTDLLHTNSRQFGYDPLLLLAVMKVESVFDPQARGRFRSGDLSGALGLMQLKLATAQETANMLKMPTLSPEDLLKPDINMLLGTAYLTKLISRFRSFKLGIIAYNIGPEKVKMTMRNKQELPLNYYKKVIQAYYTLNNYLQKTTGTTP